MLKYIQFQSITKLSETRMQTLMHWLKKQNFRIKLEVFKEQKNLYFKLKNIGIDNDLLSISSFYMAIDKLYTYDKEGKQKNKVANIDSIATVSSFHTKKHKKVIYSQKKERLLTLWSVVVKLKNEDYSFRDISHYLLSRHRFNVSHSYIHQLWKELGNE